MPVGLVKPRFCRNISKRLEAGVLPLMDQFWCFMMRQSVRSNVRTPIQSVSRVRPSRARIGMYAAVLRLLRHLHALEPQVTTTGLPLGLTASRVGIRNLSSPFCVRQIVWKVITDLPIDSRAAAVEKLNWYAMRWKIETYHKIMKSGCRVEQSKMRTAER